MEKEREIWEYEKNAIAKALQNVKRDLHEDLNNPKVLNKIIDAMRMDVKDAWERINWRFVIDVDCSYVENGVRYLIIKWIPYPEIKGSQTDVGYQIINENWKDTVYIWEFVNWKKEWHGIRYTDWWFFEWEFKDDEMINNYR